MIYLHKLNSERTVSSLSDFIHNVFLYDGFFNVIGQFSNKKKLFLIANFGSTFFFLDMIMDFSPELIVMKKVNYSPD